MSDNLVTNINNSIENFAMKPGYSKGDITNTNKSFSALNIGDKNLHNSIFSNLATESPNNRIIKHNHKFEGNMSKIDPYFYNENAGSAVECLKECDKVKQCSSYTYTKSDKNCTLYNSIPNKLKEDTDSVSGYKTNYNYSMDNLTDDQVSHIQNRIGSMYLHKKFDVVNKDDNKNMTKCIRGIKGADNVRMLLSVTVSGDRWSGSGKVTEVYLRGPSGARASKTVFIDNKKFIRGRTKYIDINFPMMDSRFNKMCFKVGNDGVKFTRIALYLIVNNSYHKILNRRLAQSFIKNKEYCYFLGKTIDINNLKFGADVVKILQGTGEYDNRWLRFKGSDSQEVYKILKKPHWNISFSYRIKQSFRGWRNIFHCGNSNVERAPALWIVWNDPWKMHFRIRTNFSWNDGFDFYVPREFRKYNQDIEVNLEFDNYYDDYWRKYGFIVMATVNGKFAGARSFYNRYRNYWFYPLNNRFTYIKDPWYSGRNTYSVSNLTFTHRKLIYLTSGRKWGHYENSNRFNNLVCNLPTPFYIIKYGYRGYTGQYMIVVYKRLTSAKGVDMHKLFHVNWFNERYGVKNKFNTDFKLYSTLEDAVNDSDPWDFCNFNDPGVGAFRDCGPSGGIGGQWQSTYRGGKKTWKLMLYKGEASVLDTSVNKAFVPLITGYTADPKCIYNNIDKTNDIFDRNMTVLKDTTKPFNISNSNQIEADMHNFSVKMDQKKDYKSAAADTKDSDLTLSSDYAEFASEIASIKNDESALIDTSGLKKAVGGNITENFESNCNSHSKYMNWIIGFIVILVIYLLLNYLS